MRLAVSSNFVLAFLHALGRSLARPQITHVRIILPSFYLSSRLPSSLSKLVLLPFLATHRRHHSLFYFISSFSIISSHLILKNLFPPPLSNLIISR